MANLYLYHGTDMRISNPRWDLGDEGRDFGRCFYTTYDRKTARDWARKNFRNSPVVNRYSINLEELKDGGLKIKRFHADAENGLSLYGEIAMTESTSVPNTTLLLVRWLIKD